jgi:cell wall-associated NlpC family hydrolase
MRHVGIYLEDGKFLHASTEKGVMLSNLDDQYWARTYWKSVRVQSMNGAISDAR